jgi:hypothetical protein
MRNLPIAASIVVAGALIAVAILIVGRWEISGSAAGLWLLDRWSGDIRVCVAGTPKANCL